MVAIPEYWNSQTKVAYNINSRNKLLFNAVGGADNIKIEDDVCSFKVGDLTEIAKSTDLLIDEPFLFYEKKGMFFYYLVIFIPSTGYFLFNFREFP